MFVTERIYIPMHPEGCLN